MFKKPTSKSAETAIPEVLGAVAGYMVSNAVCEAIHKPLADGATVTEIEKSNKMRTMVSGGMLVVAIAGLCAISGSDTKTNVVKGMLTGATVAQSRNLISDQAKKASSLQAKIADNSKVMNRMYKGALGCPCEDTSLGYVALNRPKRRGMKGAFDTAQFYQPQILVQAPSESQSAISNWRSVA